MPKKQFCLDLPLLSLDPRLCSSYLPFLFQIALLLLLFVQSASAQGSFIIIEPPAGYEFSYVTDISADGSVVVGNVGYFDTELGVPITRSFRWTAGEGLTLVPLPMGAENSYANSISSLTHDIGMNASGTWIWRDEEFFYQPPVPESTFKGEFTLQAISSNSSVLVGIQSTIFPRRTGGANGIAPVAAQNGVAYPLPIPPESMTAEAYWEGAGGGFAYDVSNSGSTIVGYINSPVTGLKPTIWVDGQYLILGAEGQDGKFTAVSGDGKVAGGELQDLDLVSKAEKCALWSSDSGFQFISELTELNGCVVRDLNYNGTIAVLGHYLQTTYRGFLWDEEMGFRDLRDALALEFGYYAQVQDIETMSALTISDNGSWIGGSAILANGGGTKAWIARIQSWDIVDTVPELLDGDQVTTDFETLATKGRPVTAISADGVSQIVARIWVGSNYSLPTTVELVDENGQPPANPGELGSLAPIDLDAFNSNASSVAIDVVPTSIGNMLFIKYRAPENFVRASNETADEAAKERKVTLKFNYPTGASEDIPLTIVRPPVLLIHGTFSNPGVWDASTDLVGDSNVTYLSF